jgi:hypothetical protein
MSRIETEPFVMHVPAPKPDDMRLTVKEGDVDGFVLNAVIRCQPSDTEEP